MNSGLARYWKQVKGYCHYWNIRKRSLSTCTRYTVTLFPGDGIGPEISRSVQDVFAAAELPIDWEVYNVSTKSVKPGQDLIPKEALDAVKRNGYGLKGRVVVGLLFGTFLG